MVDFQNTPGPFSQFSLPHGALIATFPISVDDDMSRTTLTDVLSTFQLSGTTIHHFLVKNGCCSDELCVLHALLIHGTAGDQHGRGFSASYASFKTSGSQLSATNDEPEPNRSSFGPLVLIPGIKAGSQSRLLLLVRKRGHTADDDRWPGS